MRIAWCGPRVLTDAETSVARALNDLGHDVVLIRLGDGPPEPVQDLPSLSWRERDRLGAVDVRFYTAVDDFDAVAPLFDLARREPGAILFRDASMNRYFEALWIASGRPRRRPDQRGLVASALGIVTSSEAAERALAHLHSSAILILPTPSSSPESQRYAAHLIDFVAGTARNAPLLRAADYVATLLRETGVQRGDSIVDRIASAAQDLFG